MGDGYCFWSTHPAKSIQRSGAGVAVTTAALLDDALWIAAIWGQSLLTMRRGWPFSMSQVAPAFSKQ